MKKHARGKWAGIVVPVLFIGMLISPFVLAAWYASMVNSVGLSARFPDQEEIDETQRRGNVLVERLEAYFDRYGQYPKTLSSLDGNPASSPELVPVWDKRQWWYSQRDDGADFELGFSPVADMYPYHSYQGSTGRWFCDY